MEHVNETRNIKHVFNGEFNVKFMISLSFIECITWVQFLVVLLHHLPSHCQHPWNQEGINKNYGHHQ
jgi:hypothetical protein